MTSFIGRRVMVTGAAGGIGQELCRHFAGLGADILALDKDAAALEAMEIPAETAPRIDRQCADLTDAAVLAATVDAYAERSGPIDILINNAGAAAATALSNLDAAGWASDIELNLTGAYHCVEAVKARMFAAGKGVILSIGSVNGLTALGHPAYSAAKAGLISYTKSLAVEYGPRGIRANILCPGTVRTQAWDIRAAANPAIFTQLRRWYPLRDFPQPIDIAKAAAFLASDDARMITGVVLPIDSGLTAGNPVMAGELTLQPF